MYWEVGDRGVLSAPHPTWIDVSWNYRPLVATFPYHSFSTPETPTTILLLLTRFLVFLIDIFTPQYGV